MTIQNQDFASLFNSVLHTGTLEVDSSGNCFYKHWNVKFTGVGGNKPSFQVDISKLTGDEVNVQVAEIEEGGVLRVLTGEFLRTVETTSQVTHLN